MIRVPSGLSREPLFRLLAVNLAIGVAAAVLMIGGLLVLNPQNLRGLIAADRSPGVAIGLLLFGLLITFGSVAMGTAIMLIGRDDTDHAAGRLVPVAAKAVAPARGAVRG